MEELTLDEEPELDGKPHPPLSEEDVQEAVRVFEVLQRGEEPSDGVIAAIISIGKAAYIAAIPLLEQFVQSPDPDIRAAALQALVLDFHLAEHCRTAWKMLNDEHCEPRSVAASCIGFGYRATRNLVVIRRLASLLRNTKQRWVVRVSAYNSILDVVGYHPLHPKRRVSVKKLDSDIDWELVAKAERGEFPEKP